MPPSPAVSTSAAREVAAEVRLRDRAERLVRESQDPLRSDVEPARRRHLPEHRQAGALEVGGTPPQTTRPGRASRSRSAPAARPRDSGRRPPPVRTARAASHRRRDVPARRLCGRGQRGFAPPSLARRRPRGDRRPHRPPDQGCSAGSGGRLPAPSRDSAARGPEQAARPGSYPGDGLRRGCRPSACAAANAAIVRSTSARSSASSRPRGGSPCGRSGLCCSSRPRRLPARHRGQRRSSLCPRSGSAPG